MKLKCTKCAKRHSTKFNYSASAVEQMCGKCYFKK